MKKYIVSQYQAVWVEFSSEVMAESEQKAIELFHEGLISDGLMPLSYELGELLDGYDQPVEVKEVQPMSNRYEVQTEFLDKISNDWLENGKPITFATKAEAKRALREYLKDIKADGFTPSPSHYHIKEVQP